MTHLPIDEHIDQIQMAVRRRRAVVVTAAPGAGKTTRIPAALADDGPVLLLQPRRVAARAIARRVAEERGWTLGREVGWHVRFDRHASAETRLLVATEGILTARIQQDPLLSEFQTVVIDEFHERSIHADLGLALARQTWLARSDFRLVVMSATMDGERVSRFLDGCPLIDVPGRIHPVVMTYRPGIAVEQAIAEAMPATGALLCFLPGAPEIRRATQAVAGVMGHRVPILPLHGGLDADEQDAALSPASERRVILATNLAETTVTVPDVRVVVDTGLRKVARYDANRGIDSLELERISQDSADQRAGRAGRVQAGVAVRLWDARDRLRSHRDPEIARVDLSSVVLDIVAWGGDPRGLEWYEAPAPDVLDAAVALLRRLGAIDESGALTSLGRQLNRLPLHPRLGRLLLEAGGAPAAAHACALLAERHFSPGPRGQAPQSTSCDLLAAVDDARAHDPHVLRVRRDLQARANDVLGPGRVRAHIDDATFRRAVLAAYGDRVAKRRASGGDRFLLASGAGARLGRESGVFDGEFIVAVDVTGAPSSGAGSEAIIRMASSVDRDWLRPTSSSVEHMCDEEAGVVRAARVDYYDALVLSTRPMPPDPVIRSEMIAALVKRRGPSGADEQLMRRIAFAGMSVTFDELVDAAAGSATRVIEVDIETHLAAPVNRTLDKEAPATWTSPRGRRLRLDYRADGRVVAAVKLQDMFGVHDTPTIGSRRRPITLELLAPNGRSVQITSDLKSFWESGYAVVRKELRARYPKHAWPEKP